MPETDGPYDTVQIHPMPTPEGERWCVVFTRNDALRVRTDTAPRFAGEVGFFHYLRAEVTPRQAVQRLKAFMVEKGKAEIARLTKSVEELELLAEPRHEIQQPPTDV